MKLLKKLMPVATVAATAACVVPMTTSCAKTLITVNDLQWTPDQHAAVSGGLTVEEAKKEYFKDGLKTLAQDLAYISVLAINEQLDELKETATISKSTFNLKIQNGTFQEKTITISGKEQAGYLISATIIAQQHLEYELKTPTAGKKETHIKDSSTYTEVKNAFLTFDFDDSNIYWFSNIALLKDASDSWTMLVKETENDKLTIEYEKGSTVTATIPTAYSQYQSCKAGFQDQETAMEIPSYIFANVAHKDSK